MNNLTEKNGHPSMEEILASIRRIIADEPPGSSPLIQLKSPVLRDADGRAHPVLPIDEQEQGDFELPAIFRTQPAQPEKPTALFGRLTDAIRNASGVSSEEARAPRAREMVQADGLPGQQHTTQNGQHGSAEPLPQFAPAPVAGAHLQIHPAEAASPYQGASAQEVPAAPLAAQVWQDSPSLSSLSLARSDGRTPEPPVPEAPAAPGPAGGGWWGRTASAPTPQPEPEPKRVMVPFRDTRMSLLGTVPAYAPLPAGTVATPIAADVPPPFVAAPEPQSSVPTPYAGLDEPVMLVPQASLPAAVPAARTEGAGLGSVEDATADLLRPMLRQWLAENMPRMVEKALHIEVAESVKASRRPPGSE